MISVIVPVCNGEPYIRRCLDSILANTYRELELIVAENGSTDATPDILRAYEERDPRVKVLLTGAEGQSCARNIGIEAASGDYIAFVDADDYVSPYLYETMLTAAEKQNCDLVMCGFVQGEKTDYAFLTPAGQACLCTTDECYAGMYLGALYEYTVVWNKLIRRDCLGDTRFDESLRYAEDRGFISRCICRAGRICRIPDKMYYYWRGNKNCISLTADQYERMSLVYGLQKDQTFMDTAHPDRPLWGEYVSCSLLQNADVRLKRARKNGMPDLQQELKPIVADALRRVRHAGHLPLKVKLRFLVEHDAPGLFALVSRISGH